MRHTIRGYCYDDHRKIVLKLNGFESQFVVERHQSIYKTWKSKLNSSIMYAKQILKYQPETFCYNLLIDYECMINIVPLPKPDVLL